VWNIHRLCLSFRTQDLCVKWHTGFLTVYEFLYNTSYWLNVHLHQHQEKNYWKNCIKNSLQILLFLVTVLLFSQKLTGSNILNQTKIKGDVFSSHLAWIFLPQLPSMLRFQQALPGNWKCTVKKNRVNLCFVTCFECRFFTTRVKKHI
jgi:hypothetical protein